MYGSGVHATSEAWPIPYAHACAPRPHANLQHQALVVGDERDAVLRAAVDLLLQVGLVGGQRGIFAFERLVGLPRVIQLLETRRTRRR